MRAAKDEKFLAAEAADSSRTRTRQSHEPNTSTSPLPGTASEQASEAPAPPSVDREDLPEHRPADDYPEVGTDAAPSTPLPREGEPGWEIRKQNSMPATARSLPEPAGPPAAMGPSASADDMDDQEHFCRGVNDDQEERSTQW